jgi:hypothetical protein
MKAITSLKPSIYQSTGGLHHATAKAGIGATGDEYDWTPTQAELDYWPSDSSSSWNWENTTTVVNSISNAFAKIFGAVQPLPAGCTQVAGPYGMSTQCAGSGTPTLSLSSFPTSLGGSSIYIIGALAIGAILLLKK